MIAPWRLACFVGAWAAFLGPAAAWAADPVLAVDNSPEESRSPDVPIDPLADGPQANGAYQALAAWVERQGCGSGDGDGGFLGRPVIGRQAMNRYEVAALLNRCLDRGVPATDGLMRLLQEFARERQEIASQSSTLQKRLDSYTAQQFAPTTQLRGSAYFALGALAYGGYNLAALEAQLAAVSPKLLLRKGTSLNYKLVLNLDTSYSGQDRLRLSLRAGNFGASAMAGRILPLAQQDAAFEPDAGPNIVGVEKLVYQTKLGPSWTLVLGPRLSQSDVLALNPSLYPKDPNLKFFTYDGAPGAYNSIKGPGGGLIWRHQPWMASISYSARRGMNGSTDVHCLGLTEDEEDAYTCTRGSLGGGLFTASSGGASTVQIGYAQSAWKLAAAWTNSNATVGISGSTPLAASAIPSLLQGGGAYNGFALGGSWEPKAAGWLPSISLGAGLNVNRYGGPFNNPVMIQGQVLGLRPQYKRWSSSISQSWFVGLQWKDVWARGNTLGIAIGQPNYLAQAIGANQQTLYFSDGQYAIEAWYSVQVTDRISVTPAIFYLSNPYGDLSTTLGGGSGSPFSVIGAVLKTTLKF